MYLEVGARRVFAGALDWPGWCRSGRDEESAVGALVEYAPRYARGVKRAAGGFTAPKDPSALRVMERLKGNATTDFGAPGIAPASKPRVQLGATLASSISSIEATIGAREPSTR